MAVGQRQRLYSGVRAFRKLGGLKYEISVLLRMQIDPFFKTTTLEEADIIPDKRSDTRIKNKAVAFDQRPRPLHNRYTRMGACVLCLVSLGNGRYI